MYRPVARSTRTWLPSGAIRSASADSSTKLVKLCQTEPLGIFDDHDRGVGPISLAADHGLGARSEKVVVVKAGDTLSQIAADHSAGDWPAFWSANQDRPEPEGQVLTDPDHIEPGWTIAVPGTSPLRAPAATNPVPSLRPTPRPTPQALKPPHLTVLPGGAKVEPHEQEPSQGVSPQAVP